MEWLGPLSKKFAVLSDAQQISLVNEFNAQCKKFNTSVAFEWLKSKLEAM